MFQRYVLPTSSEPLKRRSTIILHGSTSQKIKSKLHTRRRESLKSHINLSVCFDVLTRFFVWQTALRTISVFIVPLTLNSFVRSQCTHIDISNSILTEISSQHVTEGIFPFATRI
jgi:hypothetical protein